MHLLDTSDVTQVHIDITTALKLPGLPPDTVDPAVDPTQTLILYLISI
jgi:hypothetical protein